MTIKTRQYTLPQLLKMVAEFEGSIDEKSKLLQTYQTKELLWSVDFMYNYNDMPLPVPEFIPSKYPADNNFMTIRTALPNLNAALRVRGDEKRYNRIMYKVLENISKEESDLLVHVFSGKKIEGISKAVFRRAFPNFFLQHSGD